MFIGSPHHCTISSPMSQYPQSSKTEFEDKIRTVDSFLDRDVGDLKDLTSLPVWPGK